MSTGIRRTALAGLILAILFSGCGRQKEKRVPAPAVTEGAVTQEPATGAAVTGAASEGASSLESKSRRYAEQIVTGLFDELRDNFTQVLKDQIDMDDLRASWESVAAGANGYEGISKVEISEDNGYQIVLVTLRYKQNQGRTIRFVYDGEENIAGIWFDIVMLQGEDGATGDGSRWSEEDITIGRDPYTLKGKIVIPSGEKAPVVILIADRGDADLDGTIGKSGNTPLCDIAYGLAEKGIASVRYNRRACEYTGSVSTEDGSYDTLCQDVWYAVDQMYNDKRVDRDRIYLLAMGRSADLLPALVKKKAGRLSGAVMMAAKPVCVAEQYYSRKEQDITSDAAYFMKENSTFPLLMLQGEEDFQTTMDDFEQWRTVWKGRSHVVYHSYRYLNHYFMRSSGKETQEEYDKKGSVSQSVIDDIAAWLEETGQ